MEPGLLRIRERKEGCWMAFTVTSPAFRNGNAVPRQFTCDGSDTPPPLEVSGAPEGTRSFAVIMDDPDAPNGTFIHWLAYDVPAGKGELEVDRGKTLRNGFGREVGSLATRPSSAG
jgi:Raf kinase inhibitor-like YbhB/YbcL family protein